MHIFTVVLMQSDLRPHLFPSRFTQHSAGRSQADLGNTLQAAQANKAQKKLERETSAGLAGLGATLCSSGHAPACSTISAVPSSAQHLCPTVPVWTGSASAATAARNCRERTEFGLPGKSQGEQAPPLGAGTRKYPAIY